MKAMILSLIPLLICAATVNGQSIPSTSPIIISSMHVVAEPRSVALGESVAGSATTASAWSINPATLAGVKEIGADYNRRDFHFPFVDHNFASTGVWVGTGIGTFALHYNLYDQGEWQATFENGASGEVLRMFDYTIAASYATDLLSPLALGATIKLFSAVMEAGSSQRSNAHGIYADLGLLYSAAGLLLSGERSDSLHACLAMRNIGGDLLMPEMSIGGTQLPRQRQQVGRMVEAGIEYDLPLLPQNDRPLIRSRLTVGLQMLLNDRSSLPGSSGGIRTNGSAGLEAVVYDIVALRLGTVIQSVDDVYGEAGTPTLRYGFGLNLPLTLLGLDIPITIGGDYARVTMRQLPDPFFGYPGNDLEAFGLHVAYTAPIIR